jgi:hypothetical protein
MRRSLAESMGGLEVRVTPAVGSPAFDALLVRGCREYEDGDLDNAALVQVQRLDDHWDRASEPEYFRVRALRISS